ncbi:MAG: 3-hydroxyacyl-ACP dehydratase [Flavobacteriaceae bacterium]|nr:3-hydroxyacyl-ACP dehydratase [Mangrovimonas sp.]MCB0469390.1 3-hydroxyacyl-ACP dehydratase [Flavobacteriaceae bacterium]HRV55514.1 3-hydroxyacyl-ACP dehydratase [Mangrovimonas sp.]
MLDNFYTLKSLSTEGNKTKALITINKDHEVFKGHFPGNPVTPGVCMMQIIKELTEDVVGEKLFMQASSNIKFMALINPEKNPDLVLDLEITETEGGYKVKNETRFEETLALKLSSLYSLK